jgi:hypothetical protein
MTPTEFEAIVRRVVRDELARVDRSGATSGLGIAAPGQGDDQCSDEERIEFMDPTNTERDGELSSLERMARDDVARLRRGQPLKPTSSFRAVKRRDGR